MNPHVSVILPVFNGERYLKRSIQSFLKQTLKDIELIIVNDGSTDNTQAIIDYYASRDRRIKIIRFDENRGNLSARKAGVMAASGDYIMFLDADDALFLNACKQAWLRATETNADIFQFNSEIVFVDENIGNFEKNEAALPSEYSSIIIDNLRQILKPYEGTLTGERILRGCYELNLFYYTIWNKIYRREICQAAYSNIPEIYINIGEDDFAFFFIAYFSKKYVGDPRLTLYYYTFGSGITTKGSVSLKKIRLLSKCMQIPKIIERFLSAERKTSYFRLTLESITSRYKQAIFENVGLFLNEENNPEADSALTSVLEYIEPLELIQSLETKFFEKPSLVAERFLKTDLAKPIHKPIKTIGTYYFRLHNGGVERVLSLIIPLWVEMGYQVILFTDEPANDLDYVINAPYTRVVLPKCTSFLDYKVKADALDSALRKYEVDLLVYHKWMDKDLLWDLLVCKQANCAFYIYAHGTIDTFNYVDPYYQQYLLKLPAIYKLADCVIALTAMDAAFWNQVANRTYQINNPCSLPVREIKPRTNQQQRILWVGRISGEKQPIESIKIFATVLERLPNAELYIVGTGEPGEVKKVIDYAKKLEILDHVTLVGFHSDLEQFYARSDILLFTSKFEGFGMTLIEAQSFGLPIVMYELPYLEIVKGCQGIIAVNQLAAEDAGNAIIDILTDQTKYSHLSEEAFNNAIKFSKIDLKKKWQEIFSTTEIEKTLDSNIDSVLAVRLAYNAWTKFCINYIQNNSSQSNVAVPQMPDISEEVNQAIQAKMVNMPISEATIHLMKTIARRILGENISYKIHLLRIRMMGKTENVNQ